MYNDLPIPEEFDCVGLYGNGLVDHYAGRAAAEYWQVPVPRPYKLGCLGQAMFSDHVVDHVKGMWKVYPTEAKASFLVTNMNHGALQDHL